MNDNSDSEVNYCLKQVRNSFAAIVKQTVQTLA